jgi:adenylate cyclase
VDRAPLLAALIAALAVAAGVIALRARGLVQPLDLALYDAYRSSAAGTGSERVVLVVVSEDDIRWLDEWPMSDQDLALILDRLSDAGARAIGIDLYRDLPVSPGSALLSAELLAEPRIIGVFKLGGDGATGVRPPAALADSDRTGFNDFVLDPDGCARRGLLFAESEDGRTAHSFGLRVALQYLADSGIAPAPDPELPERLRLGPTAIPWLEADAGGYVGVDAGGYQFLLDHRAGAGGFETIRLAEVMADDFERMRLRGRAVLIGSAAESAPDPFDICRSGDDGQGSQIPGVELHAHVVDQLLRYALGESRPHRTPAERSELLWIAALAALGAAAGLLRRGALASGALLVAGVVALLGIGLLAYRSGWWIPLAAPGLAWILAAGSVITWVSSNERRQRALLMELFAQHQSPAIAEELWKHRAEFLDGGRLRPTRLVATVLFMDMKGSTSISERLEPHDLMEFINDFMATMAQLVTDHGGYVDDYFGDGLKADFGVPLARSDEAQIREDARSAVRCALAASRALSGINAAHRARGWPPIAMRVGIHTGSVVTGCLGSAQKLKFTVVGDVVVAAARLESLEGIEHDFEAQPARILISAQTLERLGAEFRTDALGSQVLKGRSQPLEVFRVHGPRESEILHTHSAAQRVG